MRDLVKPWWTRWMATRWGFAYHTCHLWCAVGKVSPLEWFERFGRSIETPVDVIVVYRELILEEITEPLMAKSIVDATPEPERKLIMRHVMTPPSAFGSENSRHTVADQMGHVLNKSKLPIPSPGDEDRIGGWRLLYNCFYRTNGLRDKDLSREQCEEGPFLFVTANCIHVIDAMPILTRSAKDSEDVSVNKLSAEEHDDTPDACGEALRILIKSMMSAKVKAPRAVRKREVWESYEDPTSRAIAMLKFDHNEKKKHSVTRRKRWR